MPPLLARVVEALAAIAAFGGAAVGAAAAPAPQPCYTAINDAVGIDSVKTIETPCATTLFDYEDKDRAVRLVIRAYPAAAAFIVESSLPDDPGNSFDDNVFFTSSFLFDYLTGQNANKQNLAPKALTAPFTLRPPVAGRTADEDWVGSMALAPSVWHPGGKPQPPASTISTVDVALFGGVTMAARPVLLSTPPTEDDFRNAYSELEIYLAFLPLPGRWVINTTSAFSPSFNFFYTQSYNGSTWQIEAAAEVFHVSS
jgi:hypothetical protein